MASPYANWSVNAYYRIGDIVQYPAGSFFQAILANIGVPPSASSPWSAYSPSYSGGVTALNGESGSLSIVGGTNVTIDTSVPSQIKINSGASGGAGVLYVIPGDYILVDNADSTRPVVSVNAGAGLGGSTDENPSLIVLAGNGITANQDGVSVNAGVGLTIDEGALAVDYGNGLDISGNTLQNSGILSVGVGSGLTSTGGQNPTITNDGILSLTVGYGLDSTGGQNPNLVNDGIVSLDVGQGITSTGGQNPTIANSGILTLDVGTGLDTSTPSGSQNPVIVNSGVINVYAGTGITSSGGQYPTIGNSGVLDLTAGTGITSTGGQYPSIANSGILTIDVGTGLDSTGGQNPFLFNNGIITLDVGSGLTSTGGQFPTIANSGVLALTAGTGVTITGSKTNYTISAPTQTIYTAVYRTIVNQTITGGHTFNGNLVWGAETYSTPSSMSLATQSGGTGSMTLWRCPISGVWSISLSMTVEYNITADSHIVMIQYINSSQYYLPQLNVIKGQGITGANNCSMTGTNILTAGSYYVISTPPASTVDVTFYTPCVWTLTYLGPSP